MQLKRIDMPVLVAQPTILNVVEPNDVNGISEKLNIIEVQHFCLPIPIHGRNVNSLIRKRKTVRV